MTIGAGKRFAGLLVLIMVSVAGTHAQDVQPRSQPSATGRIEGRVLHQGPSDPLSGTQVTLVRVNPGAPLTPEVLMEIQEVATLMKSPVASPPGFIDGFLTPAAQSVNVAPDLLRPLSQAVVLADAEGGFRFEGLAAGRYLLTAEREGYLDPLVGGYSGSITTRTILVEDGKSNLPVELSMIRGGTISGTVHDPDGQPVPKISVDANQVQYPKGRASFFSKVSATTNDRGEFRLFWLPPGDYFIGATPKAPSAVPGPQDTWAATYFPGGTDPAGATAFTIREGDALQDVDINMRMSGTRTYTISGTAINPTAVPNPISGKFDPSVSEFILVPRKLSLADGIVSHYVSNALPAESRTHGEFQIRNVKPGSYDIYPYAPDFKNGRHVTGRTSVEIKNSDITGVSLTVNTGATLAAEVLLEGVPSASISLNTLHVNLSPLDSTPREFASSIGSLAFDINGKLKADGIAEARYTLGLSGLPDAAYIADIRQEDRSVYNDGFVVGPQLHPIQVVIRPDGATVRGDVETAGHKAAANVTVILVPPASQRRNPALFKVAATSGAGAFSMTGVMPGIYTIFALEDCPFREPWQNAEFIAKYEKRARPVVVEPGSTTEIRMDLIEE